MATYTPLNQGVAYDSGLQIVDELLTTLAKQFKPHGFIYDDLVAPIPVNRNVGRYPIFDPASFFQNAGNLLVADDARTPMIDFNWSTDTYSCDDYRLQTKITRKEVLQASDVLRLGYSKTVGLLTTFASNREYRLAAKLQPTSVTTAYGSGAITGQFTNTASSPSTKWDAGVSGSEATIQKDLQAAALTVYKSCGVWPNTLVINKEVALAISADYTVRETVKYLVGTELLRVGGEAGQTSQPSGGAGILPATLFGFRVIVADGTLTNTARPGQTASLSDIWGNNARLLYCNPQAQWGVPATVYSFRGRVNEGAGETQPPAAIMPNDSGEPGASSDSWTVVDRWWDYDPPAEHIRVWECVDEKVVAPETGVLIPTVLGSY